MPRYLPPALLAAVALALIFAAPAYGQIEIEDLGTSIKKPLEPWGGASDFDQDYDDDDPGISPAQIGDGFIIMSFRIDDRDSQNDNPSDVALKCFIIENLGSATGSSDSGDDDGDILQVGLLDQDGNLLKAGEPTSDGTPENIAFHISFGDGCREDAPNHIGDFNFTNNPQENRFVIPDEGSEVFQIAVLVNDTNDIEDRSQGHTLQLRATVEYTERVGSFPTDTDFTATVTDSYAETIWNGGINDWSEDTFVVEPLMPNQTGMVSRFTVCDYDANEHNLIVDEMRFRQGQNGTALHSDLNTLKVYRLDGNVRTLVATTSVDSQNFDRQNSSLGVSTGDLNIFIPDDGCATFEVEAEISPYAFKGKTIQLETRLSTKEIYRSQTDDFLPINTSVDPMIRTRHVTVIGKGLVGLGSVDLIAREQGLAVPTGQIPVYVQGMKLPGLGGMQATFRFDPDVITVSGITSVPGYTANGGAIDNRRGEFTFQILASDLTEADFDPSDETVEGIVAYIDVNVAGTAGDRSRLLLELHDLKLSNSAEEIAGDVGVQPGEVRLVPRGDVNGDLSVTINDAILLANELLGDCSGLEDFQQIVADVMEPQTDEIPVSGFDGCSGSLDSNDVAEIARLALDETGAAAAGVGRESAPLTPLAVSRVQTRVDGGTLEVAVQGSGIRRIDVDVYDLAGQRMIAKSTEGSHLRLRARSTDGRPLANGVYLYSVTVTGSTGQVHRSEVRKLVLLR